MLSIFSCACWQSVCLLWKNVFSTPAHFLNRVIWFSNFHMLLLYSVVIIYSNLFCVNSLGFSTNRIISFANKDRITSSFPFWLPLIFFFFFMLDRISTSVLNRSDNNRHLCFVPGLKRESIQSINIKYDVQFSRSVVSDCLRPHGLQHARPPCPSPTPRVHSNSCLLSQWCHPTISSSVVPFSSCLQSFPASGSFQISQFFISGGQSIGVSALASVLPMNIQDWYPLGWTGWISLQSKGLSRVFSNTTVQKHQFFGVQLSL